MDIGCTLGITVVALGLSAMFYGYKIKTDKKGIILEKNDKQHEHKHHQNEERIIELEKKNGHEQRQINDLKADLLEEKKTKGELKDLVIKLQDRIINCEKNRNVPIKGGIPTPPPPPIKEGIKKPLHQPNNKQKHHKKGGWNEIHEAIKKRRKDLGEDN